MSALRNFLITKKTLDWLLYSFSYRIRYCAMNADTIRGSSVYTYTVYVYILSSYI